MASVALSERPGTIEFLGKPKFWVWVLVIVLALAAGGALLVLKPVTQVTYPPEALIGAVRDKLDYGVYNVETDTGGQRFRWLSDRATLIFPVTSHKQPLKITFRMRGATAAGGPASTTNFKLNYLEIGEVKPTAEFQDYTFTLVPNYVDTHRLEFQLETTPFFQPSGGDNRKLGNMIQSVTVDIGETWSPVQRPGRAWLIWLLPLLALPLLGLIFLARSKIEIAQMAGYGAVVLSGGLGALMLLWLFLLSRVSYNGNLNRDMFWVWAGSAGYLAAFFGWVALDGLGWGRAGAPSLLVRLRERFTPWVLAHPAMAALLGLFAFNFALTAVFYAKVFIEAGNLDPIVRYWDGPEYLVIANGFYDRNDPLLAIPNFGLKSPNYWAAHFPGYPALMRLAWFGVGWQAAGPLVSFVAATLFAFVMWKLLREFGYALHPFWLACVGLVLPLRWLVYHNVSASEPLALLFEMYSIYLFKKERYWSAGLMGVGALLVRPPGIFLWFGYLAFIGWEAGSRMWQEGKFSLGYINWKAVWGVSLIPISLIGVFAIFAWRLGDFLAYFHIDTDVKHVGLLPFSTLVAGDSSGGGIFYYYIFEFIGLILLWRQGRRDLFFTGLSMWGFTIFLLYSDVLRYSLGAFPMLLLIPFANLLSGKAARWLAAPVLVAIFLYSWGILNINLAKLDTWQMMKDILR